jgi:hypothetical protein
MTRRPPELVRAALAELAAAGISATVESGGRHFKIHFIDRAGRSRFVVVARTPSDRRAWRKSRAVIRRMIAATGHPGQVEASS